MAAVLNQEPVKALLSDIHSQLPIGQRFLSSLAGTTTRCCAARRRGR